MFQQKGKIIYIDVTNLDVSDVITADYMFSGTGSDSSNESFKIVGLDDWNTTNIESTIRMFYCVGYWAPDWDIGDLSGWDMSSNKRFDSMFDHAGSRAETFDIGDLDNWDVSSGEWFTSTFSDAGACASTFNIGKLDNWNLASALYVTYMFDGAGASAETFDIGDLSTKIVTRADGTTYTAWDMSGIDMLNGMFRQAGRDATYWSIGDISNWNTSNVTLSNTVFYNVAGNATQWSIGDLSTKTVTLQDGTTYTAWDVSQVTNMTQMFASAAKSATGTLDLSSWNVANVTSYSNFATDCGLTVIEPAFGS